MKYIRHSIWGLLLTGLLVSQSGAEPFEMTDYSTQDIILAIDHAQTKNPTSFFFENRFQPEKSDQSNIMRSSCDINQSHRFKISGEAKIGDEHFVYSIDASEKQLVAIFKNDEVLIDLEKASQDPSLQVTLLPCATPIGAVICVGGGAGYCAWRVHNCQQQQQNCQCGVMQVACGICGEGEGVVCAPCNPFPVPGPFPNPPPWPPWPDDPT